MEVDFDFGMDQPVVFYFQTVEEKIIGSLMKIAADYGLFSDLQCEEMAALISEGIVQVGAAGRLKGPGSSMAKALLAADYMPLNTKIEVNEKCFTDEEEDKEFFLLFDGLEDKYGSSQGATVTISDMITDAGQKERLDKAFSNYNEKLPDLLKLREANLDYFRLT